MLSHLKDQSFSLIAFSLFIGPYLLYNLVRYIIIARRRNLIIRDNGCKHIPAYPHKDVFFGIDTFLEILKLVKTGGVMGAFTDRYYKMKCWTYTSLSLGQRMLNTAEPENIKAILATQFQDFDLPPRRKAAFGPVFGHGIFTTDGKEWEASRAMLRPNFTRSQVGDLVTFESHISKLIARIPKDGSTVDLQPLFFMLTMDSATEFLFGNSTDVLAGGTLEQRGNRFAEAFNYVIENIGKRNRYGKFRFLVSDKKYEEEKDFVHQFIREYVDAAVESNKLAGQKEKTSEGNVSRYVFLEELAKTGVGAKKIQDELLNILLAGRDTTAALLSFLFYILARRPDVVKKLRREMSTLGDKPPTFESIKSLKYLSWVLNETLRLYPIVPGNSRTAVRDTTLPVGGGPDGKSPIFIPKGMQCNYTVYAMHRRQDFYGTDALEFKPERWEHLRVGWQYLPFNGGPRICIGQQFALTEASYTTIRILQCFREIEKRDDSELKETLTVTMSVRPGTKVGLIPA